MLTDPARAETEEVIDFGHARAFFPDADVFPNVVVARRPDGTDVPNSLTVAVPPRETLPDERLGAAVHAASFPLLRASLGREGWALEPKPVMDLLAKVWLVPQACLLVSPCCGGDREGWQKAQAHPWQDPSPAGGGTVGSVLRRTGRDSEDAGEGRITPAAVGAPDLEAIRLDDIAASAAGPAFADQFAVAVADAADRVARRAAASWAGASLMRRAPSCFLRLCRMYLGRPLGGPLHLWWLLDRQAPRDSVRPCAPPLTLPHSP